MNADVLIVGAGIAGLGLACALARFELDVVIVEKRTKTGGIHRGDSLLPKATELLAEWGVLDAIIEAGAAPIDRLEIHHPSLGEVYRGPLQSPGDRFPYLVLPHAQIEATLMEQALATGHVRLLRPAAVVELVRDEESNRVTGAVVKPRGGSQTVVQAPLVVACDGAKSVVRRELGLDLTTHHYDHAYLGLEADRPPTYEDAMRVHLHPDGGVLLMPRPNRVGLGVLVDAGSAKTWLSLDTKTLARRIVERVPLLDGVTIHRDGAHVYALTKTHATDYVKDGAVIIGDAAHTSNPTAGQGMAMALTDAGALARWLGPVLRYHASPGSLDSALSAFERERWPDNRRVLQSSHPLALAYATRGPLWHGLKTGLIRMLATRPGQRVTKRIVDTFLRSGNKREFAPRPAERSPTPTPLRAAG